ncbi:MAG: PqqD family protein [Bacteroidetes bacterium]|nr:PqqD family protein [Bacteroidota bacterium]
MNIDELFKRKSLFAFRNVGNEKVLVPIKNNIANMTEIFTLNEVGSFIWDKIDGGNSEDDIVLAITNEFDIDELTAKKDLSDFIEKFEKIIS